MIRVAYLYRNEVIYDFMCFLEKNNICIHKYEVHNVQTKQFSEILNEMYYILKCENKE